MTDPKWLSEIREREAKATEGPWKVAPDEATDPAWKFVTNDYGAVIANVNDQKEQEANANLIAHARTDIPRLLKALDRYREALKLFSCNTPPDEVRVWNDGTVSDCCKATAALNFDPTGEG